MTTAEQGWAREVYNALQNRLKKLEAGRRKAKEIGATMWELEKWDAVIGQVKDAIAEIKGYFTHGDDGFSADMVAHWRAAVDAAEKQLCKAQLDWAAAQAAEVPRIGPPGEDLGIGF